MRPSGTEPKLKAYLETVVRVHAHTGVPAARARGADELDQLRAEMSAAHGLLADPSGGRRPCVRCSAGR